MENSSKSFVFGKDGFPTWIGQIVDAVYWEDNLVAEPTPIDDHKGSGYRYKVRLFHYNVPEKDILPDNNCLWAEVEYPVTAGSGGGAMSETPALRQGCFVRGYFIDGERKQKPIISAVIGQNLFQTILRDSSLSKNGFVPFSGFDIRGEYVTLDSFPTESSNKLPLSLVDAVSGDAVESVNIYGNNTGTPNEGHNVTESTHDGTTELESPSHCKEQLTEFQKRLQKIINDIRKLQKRIRKKYADISKDTAEIRKKVEEASAATMKFISDMAKEIRKYLKRKVNSGLNDLYQFLLPSEKTQAKAAAEKALNIWECLLDKIVFGFGKLITSLLGPLIDKVVDVAQCLAEEIAGTIIGFISSVVNATLDKVMSAVSSLANAAGGALDLGIELFQFISDIIGLFTCTKRMKCPEAKEINFWEESNDILTLDIDSIVNKANKVAEDFSRAIGVVDPDNFDFESIFGKIPNPFDTENLDAACNISALLCSPPNVIFGNVFGGSSPVANAIVGTTGEILGVDIIYGGENLVGDVSIGFQDKCGNGNGARARGIVQDGRLVDVIIDWPGRGYLTTPDGSWGGGGTTWVDAGETGIRLPDGTHLPPIGPNTTVNLPVGSTVYPPNQTPIVLEGDSAATDGGTTNFVTFTSEPPILNSRPVTDIYDVILEVGSAEVLSSGFSYCIDDEIVIENNSGAILEPIWSGSIQDTTQYTVNNIYNGELNVNSVPSVLDNRNLKLAGVNIVNRGSGFTEQPYAYVRTQCGYNARIKLNLRKKVDFTNEERQRAIDQNKVIQVVDCVGKV
jgi:flagellar hook-basal body complex protein FliE|tara:strand:- start:672 stop:3050 length:2379 start_codon:yes stop_codon:yes gene_type:complete